jgi:hypothetical protein
MKIFIITLGIVLLIVILSMWLGFGAMITHLRAKKRKFR